MFQLKNINIIIPDASNDRAVNTVIANKNSISKALIIHHPLGMPF